MSEFFPGGPGDGGRLPEGLEGPRAGGWDIETGHERVRDTALLYVV